MNTNIFPEIKATITGKDILQAVTRNCNQNYVQLMLNVRKQFGSTAGSAMIKRHREQAHLTFGNFSAFGMNVKNWLEYHEEVPPHVAQCIEVLSTLQSEIERCRDSTAKQAMQQIFGPAMAKFGRDPSGVSMALRGELADKLVAAASTASSRQLG